MITRQKIDEITTRTINKVLRLTHNKPKEHQLVKEIETHYANAMNGTFTDCDRLCAYQTIHGIELGVEAFRKNKISNQIAVLAVLVQMAIEELWMFPGNQEEVFEKVEEEFQVELAKIMSKAKPAGKNE